MLLMLVSIYIDMLSLFIQISLNNFYFKFSQFYSALWLDIGTYSYEISKRNDRFEFTFSVLN